jgi:hypothetical protein
MDLKGALCGQLGVKFASFLTRVVSSDMVQRSPFRAARLFGGGPPTGRARVCIKRWRCAIEKTRRPVAMTHPCLELVGR